MTSVRVLVKYAVQLYYKVTHGVRVHGLEKLPDCGPYIVASNHISNHDPILLGAFLNHNIEFMAKEELFRIPVLRTIVQSVKAFPVNRNGLGIGAIRHAIRCLNTGRIVGMFPEGTRNRTGRHLCYKPGVGFIATKSTRIPIVPIAICAEQRIFFLRRFHIVVGDPITPIDSDYHLLTQYVKHTIDGLRSTRGLHSPGYIIGPGSSD